MTCRQLPRHNPRRHSETAAIREDMLRLLTARKPMSPSELFAELTDQWGTIGERRLWRILIDLEARGEAVRIGEKCRPGVGYVRPADATDQRRRAA